MKAIITGGAGFIGSHLTELCLANGLDVVVVDNLSNGTKKNLDFAKNDPKLTFILADINDPDQYASHFSDCDYVFHLAGLADIVPSIDDPDTYHTTNVSGTLQVLELARKSNVKKFVYAASSSCYGIPNNFPTNESEKCSPMYPYALTKMMGEQYVLHWGNTYDLPVISLRLFNVYGPRACTTGAYGAVFKVFLPQKIANRPFTVVGDGEQLRDFIFVRDVANAFYVAAKSSLKSEVFNIGTGDPQSINTLVKLLGGPIEYLPKRPGEPDITQADITKTKELLKWTAETSFASGVQEMLDNIDYWKDAKVWNSSDISDATKAWFKYLQK